MPPVGPPDAGSWWKSFKNLYKLIKGSKAYQPPTLDLAQKHGTIGMRPWPKQNKTRNAKRMERYEFYLRQKKRNNFQPSPTYSFIRSGMGWPLKVREHCGRLAEQSVGC